MRWTDNLRKASFRGIPFAVADSDYKSGRRIVEYEFPGRGVGATEDLGRKMKSFQISAFVLGDDYFEKRDALREALEDVQGPGELIHPFYGSLNVVCHDVSIRESLIDKGRIAYFTITFGEAGLLVEPQASVDTRSQILESAKKAKAASSSKLAKAIKLANMPGEVVQAATDKVTSATNLIKNSPVKDAAQAVADFSYKIRNFEFARTAMLNAPDLMSNFLSDSVSEFKNVSSDPKVFYRVMMSFGSSDNKAYEDTETGNAERENDEALNNFFQEQAVINAVEVAVESEFDSYDDTVSEKEFILDNFDRVLEKNFDDETFLSLGELKSLFVNEFPFDGMDLPSVHSVLVKATIPALVLSFQLYGDARRDADIIKRNKIAHPGFIPAGTKLEVLSE